MRLGTYVYCSLKQKRFIESAAAKVNRKVSNYILTAVLEQAEQDLGIARPT